MKLSEQRREALRAFAKRFSKITVLAVFTVLFLGAFDVFVIKEIFIPLMKLGMLNDSIRYYKRCEAINNGYTDNTEMSKMITTLDNKRTVEFYNSNDAVVAYISTRHSLVKELLLIVSPLAVLLLSLFGIGGFGIAYNVTFQELKEAWNKKDRRVRVRNR